MNTRNVGFNFKKLNAMVNEALYRTYQNNLLKGNRGACSVIVSELLENGIDMKTLYIDLFQRSLYEVGKLWEQHKISVAAEHLCTSITENLLNLACPYLFSEAKNGKKAIVLCTPGEYHHIGARMVADYFELNGWDGYFLGRNTPTVDLLEFIKEKKPDIIAISMSVFFSLNSLTKQIRLIRGFEKKYRILIGGQGLSGLDKSFTEQFENVHLTLSLDELDNEIFNT